MAENSPVDDEDTTKFWKLGIVVFSGMGRDQRVAGPLAVIRPGRRLRQGSYPSHCELLLKKLEPIPH